MKIDKGVVRIAKLKTNPFSDDGGLTTDWHHPKCVFETFARARVGMCFRYISHRFKSCDKLFYNKDYLLLLGYRGLGSLQISKCRSRIWQQNT